MAKKALVVDDERNVNVWYERFGSGDFETGSKDESGSLDLGLVVEKLQSTSYGVILMDSDFGGKKNFYTPEGELEFFSGKKLIKCTKEGEYGDVNKDTPFLSISSMQEHIFPKGYVEGCGPKPNKDSHFEDPHLSALLLRLYRIREKYLSEG